MLYDCQVCGACCCNTERNVSLGHRSYIEVLPSDVMSQERPDLLAQLTELDILDIPQMKLVNDEQRCIALAGELGSRVRCEIYPWRPAGCRLVEPGDDECLKARKLHPPQRFADGES